MANGFKGFGQSGQGFGGFNQSTNSGLTVDELLNVAKLQGGAVGEVAEELSHPQRSILSTVGEGFKKAFTGFVDIIAMPNQVMAGILSPEKTIGETVKENISVSDIVFKDKEVKDASLGTRIMDFTARFAVDVLSDPLTYVSFGATRGILGLSSAPKAFAGENVAKALGLTKGKAIGITEAGEEFAEGYIKSMKNGTQSMYIPQKLEEMYKAGRLGKDFKFDWRSIREASNEIEQKLTDQVLNGRLRKGDAVRAVSNLIEKNPALVETFIDKGGIKFFGKTILSGQRIRAAKAMIPGMTFLDDITYPIRNKTMALFDRERVMSDELAGGVGRLTDEEIEIAQKNRDFAEAGINQAARVLERANKVLGINKVEDDFIRSAIVMGLEPADPKNAEIWAAANGIKKPGAIRPEVWKAVGAFQKVQKTHQYKVLREAGISISDQQGYLSNILTKNKISRVGSRTGKTKASAQQMGKAIVLKGEDGTRYPTALDTVPNKMGEVEATMIVDGEEVRKTLKYIDTEKEIKQITKIADKNKTSIKKELEYLKKESAELGAGAKSSLAAETTEQIIKRMDDVQGISADDKKAIAESVSRYIQGTDVAKLAAKRLKNFYKDGVKLKSGGSIPHDKLEDIIADLSTQKVMSKQAGKSLLSRVNKVLDDYVQLPNVDEAKFKAKGTANKQAQEVIDELKSQIKSTRQKILDEGIDGTNLGSLVSQIVGRTAKNPGALKTVLDKLIKNRQLADDLFNEMNDIQRSVELDISEAVERSGMFVDQVSNQALTKARIDAKEAKLLGFEFSESATVSALLGIHEAYKVAGARHMMQEMAEKVGKVASQAPEGWRPVGITGLKFEGSDIAQLVKGSKGEEIYFHPLTAKYIEDFGKTLGGDEATENVLKAYDKINNVFKASVTSIFFAFHGRNAISNAFLSYLDIGLHALNPATNYNAAQMIHHDIKANKILDRMTKGDETAGKEYNKLMNQSIFKGNDGYDWTFGELRTIMKNNLVAFQPRNRGMIDQALDMKSEIMDMPKMLFETSKSKKLARKVNPVSTKNAAVEIGLRTGQGIEDYARSIHFMANLKATGDPLQAAQRTKMFLFDYQNLSHFERTFLRRVIPFYSFCVPDEAEILTKDGWKTVYELNKNDSVLSYNTEKEYTEWDNVNEIHKFNGSHHMQNFNSGRGYNFKATIDHRWVVRTIQSFTKNKYYGNKVKIKKGYELNSSDRLIQSSKCLIPADSILTPKEASLLGWLVTDGYHRWRKNHFESMIYQSPKKHADKIRDMFAEYISSESIHPNSGVICFRLKSGMMKNITKYFKSKDDMPGIVTRLNEPALEAMYEAMIEAEASCSISGQTQFVQKLGGVMDSFQIICQLLGKTFNVRISKNGLGYGSIRNFNHLKVNDLNITEEIYNGVVWCPVTKNQTWVMRQNGVILITGNTRKNLELQTRTLFTNPGRISQEIRAVKTIGDTMGAGQLTDEERELLPEWMQDGLNVVTKREGSTITVLNSMGLPFEQPFDQLQPNMALSAITPLLRLPVEVLTGYSTFHGKMISENTNASAFKYAPDVVKDLIGYDEVQGVNNTTGEEFTYHVSLRPKMMHAILNMPPTSRVISEFKGLTDTDRDRSIKAMDFLFGFNPRDNIDLEIEAQRREKELRKELEQTLTRARVGYSFTRYVPPENE